LLDQLLIILTWISLFVRRPIAERPVMGSAGQEYRSTLTAFCFINKMISRGLALGAIASQSGPLACKKSRVAQPSAWLHGLERLHVRGHFVNIPQALVAASLAATSDDDDAVGAAKPSASLQQQG